MASKESTPDDGVPVVRIEEVDLVDLASLLDEAAGAEPSSEATKSAAAGPVSIDLGDGGLDAFPPVLTDKAPTPIHIDVDLGFSADDLSGDETAEATGANIFKVDIDGLDDFEALLQRTMGEAAGGGSSTPALDEAAAMPAPRGTPSRRKAAITSASAKWRTPAPKRDTTKSERASESSQESKVIEELRKKVKEMTSETQSYRKRLELEAKATRGKGREDVFKALLPIMDTLELALKSMNEGHDVDKLTEGIEMVLKRLLTDLGLLGLEPITAQGEVFDPTLHEAFQQVTTGKVEPGKVAEVVRAGYRFEARLLRAAQVLVEKA